MYQITFQPTYNRYILKMCRWIVTIQRYVSRCFSKASLKSLYARFCRISSCVRRLFGAVWPLLQDHVASWVHVGSVWTSCSGEVVLKDSHQLSWLPKLCEEVQQRQPGSQTQKPSETENDCPPWLNTVWEQLWGSLASFACLLCKWSRSEVPGLLVDVFASRCFSYNFLIPKKFSV